MQLDPDMPAQEMRLHMGEMTEQEMRTARAAIRWANSVNRRAPSPSPAPGVVADSLWVPAKPEHKKIGWTYDFDQTERIARAAYDSTGYDAVMEVVEFVMAEADRRHKSALSPPHPADERVVEALPRPDAVSMASGTICLEYVDRDERDLAFDWLEAHGAGAALTASHMPVRDGQKYRLLEAGEIIASDDEFIGDDGITWERVKGWPVGFAYTHIFKSCRRPLAAARAGEDGK